MNNINMYMDVDPLPLSGDAADAPSSCVAGPQPKKTCIREVSNVDVLTGAEQEQAPTRTTQPQKSVRIDESQNNLFTCTQEVKDPSLWYKMEDYKQFKVHNMQLAWDIVKGKNGYQKVSMFWRHSLERAYKVASEESVDSLEDLDYDFQSSLLSDAEQSHLVAIYSNDSCPVGMEHLVVELISGERHSRRREQANRIFQIEETIMFPNPQVQANFIATSCQAASLTPRLFYRDTAMALAESLQQAPPDMDDSSLSSVESFDTARDGKAQC